MTFQLTEASFLKDVAAHRMSILHDQGVYRHVRFSKPDSNDQRFDLVTYPGFLVYSGDMGCYVFERLPDMFQFFRTANRDEQIRINQGYWSEKLQAVSGDRWGGKAKEFSAVKFRAAVEEYLLDEDASQELREAVGEQIIDARETESAEEAYRLVRDFEFEGFEFSDFTERDLTEYTTRFVWCCYAIAWGIRQYDAKQSLAVAA